MIEHKPQLEDGYTRIANEWLEAFVRYKAPASLKDFVLAVLRETWGWQTKLKPIPISTFERLLHVSNRRVYQLRREAIRHNLIIFDGGEHSDVAEYGIQKEYLEWVEYNSSRPAAGMKHVLHSEAPTTVKHPLHSEPVARTTKDTVAPATPSKESTTKDSTTTTKASATSDATPTKLTPQQQVIETLWAAFGFAGKPGTKGYSGIAKLVAEHGVPMIKQYAAAVKRAPPELPEGAESWAWFKQQFRAAMKRPWEWQPGKRKLGSTIPARGDVDYGEPGRIKM